MLVGMLHARTSYSTKHFLFLLSSFAQIHLAICTNTFRYGDKYILQFRPIQLAILRENFFESLFAFMLIKLLHASTSFSTTFSSSFPVLHIFHYSIGYDHEWCPYEGDYYEWILMMNDDDDDDYEWYSWLMLWWRCYLLMPVWTSVKGRTLITEVITDPDYCSVITPKLYHTFTMYNVQYILHNEQCTYI